MYPDFLPPLDLGLRRRPRPRPRFRLPRGLPFPLSAFAFPAAAPLAPAGPATHTSFIFLLVRFFLSTPFMRGGRGGATAWKVAGRRRCRRTRHEPAQQQQQQQQEKAESTGPALPCDALSCRGSWGCPPPTPRPQRHESPVQISAAASHTLAVRAGADGAARYPFPPPLTPASPGYAAAADSDTKHSHSFFFSATDPLCLSFS